MFIYIKAAALFSCIYSPCAGDNTLDVVPTKAGRVQGVLLPTTTGTVHGFLGVPYAEPPVGPNRFRYPLPKKPWAGIYNATTLPKVCLQNDARNKALIAKQGISEDCLFLNVFVPHTAISVMPVLVYIHGGGFVYGGISQDAFDTSELAFRGALVTVNIAYRLGAFGFLNYGIEDAPSNVGLYDQALAFQWVKENIKSFRGDPSRVTIMGESAGAVSVGLHMISPITRGLFRNAVMQSGSPYTGGATITREKANSLLDKLVIALGCRFPKAERKTNSKLILECLRAKDSADILKETKVVSALNLHVFSPVLNDTFAPQSPLTSLKQGHFNGVNLMASSTEGEGDNFLYNAVNPFLDVSSARRVNKLKIVVVMRIYLGTTAIITSRKIIDHYFDDVQFDDGLGALHAGGDVIGHTQLTCPTRGFAKIYRDQNNSVFMLQFSQKPSFVERPEWIRATHADDVPYSLGSLYKLAPNPTKDDITATNTFINAISTFAYTG